MAKSPKVRADLALFAAYADIHSKMHGGTAADALGAMAETHAAIQAKADAAYDRVANPTTQQPQQQPQTQQPEGDNANGGEDGEDGENENTFSPEDANAAQLAEWLTAHGITVPKAKADRLRAVQDAIAKAEAEANAQQTQTQTA